MWKPTKIVSAILFSLVSSTAMAERVNIASNATVPQSVERLTNAVEAAGARVFTTVDFAQGSASVGEVLRPTTLVIFGSPKIGAKALQKGQTMALYLPLGYAGHVVPRLSRLRRGLARLARRPPCGDALMATLAEQLTQARNQYHLLITGQAARVFVDQNGERVEYAPASAPLLAASVATLEAQIAGQTRPNTVRFATSKGLT